AGTAGPRWPRIHAPRMRRRRGGDAMTAAWCPAPEAGLRRLIATIRVDGGKVFLAPLDAEGSRALWVVYPMHLSVRERPLLDGILQRNGQALCDLLLDEERELDTMLARVRGRRV